MINAWPITPEQKAPGAPADGGRPGRLRRRGRRRRRRPQRRRGARRRRARRRRVRASCPPSSTCGRPPRTRSWRTPTWGPTRAPSGSSTRQGPAPAATSTRPSRRPATDGIVIEREIDQQRLIPAFMEPRSVVVDPTGEQITMWTSTQVPHIVRFALAATTGVPESKIRVIAPDVGGGFGGKLAVNPGGVDHLRGRPPHRRPVKYTETRSESLQSGAPRPRPVPEADAGGREGRHASPASRSTCSPTSAPTSALVGGGVPLLGAFMYNAIYKFPAYQFNCQTVFTNKTCDRRLPRRRAPRGDVRASSG